MILRSFVVMLILASLSLAQEPSPSNPPNNETQSAPLSSATPGGQQAAEPNGQSPISFELATTFAGHTDPVSAVAYSPDGQLLASGGWDGKVVLWDVDSGREVRTFVGHARQV